jgi:hypothetical protein
MVRMSFRTFIIAACAILPVTLHAQQTYTTATGNSLSAAVEEVVASEDAGSRGIAYIVRWHGTRVLVVDPLARSHLSVSDSVNFIASHHDVAGKRLLSFIFAGPGCRCDDKSGKSGATQSVNSGAKSAIGLVEEVLSADEDGYRFVAYVVQAQSARIAVSDPLAQSHHVVGENISFLALRNNVAGNPVVTFMAFPPAENTAQPQRQTQPTKTEHTGVIEEVLKMTDDGFGYTAYILNALGARIVVDDVPGALPHRLGDQISFLSQRIDNPDSSRPGMLRFEPIALEADKQEDVNLSQTQETATVDEVLSMQTDGYRYVAYIVKWHGARVAVSDVLSNTSYAVGDRINFPASRAASPEGRQLSFLLFGFDKSTAPQQKQRK